MKKKLACVVFLAMATCVAVGNVVPVSALAMIPKERFLGGCMDPIGDCPPPPTNSQ